MRQSTHVRRTALATMVGAVAALAPAWGLNADERHAPADARSDAAGPLAAPAPSPAAASAEASGTSTLRLHAIVARAWDDSIATWKRLMPQAADVGMVSLRFVNRLDPNNCYGLYAGDGPAYCSGNETVFVGVGAADRLMARFGLEGEAGITFLIGHEIGHHIQNIRGRFQMLSYMMARMPEQRADLARRFELEADCFAGVWMHASKAWSHSARFRAQLIAALGDIGDESVLGSRPKGDTSRLALHGSSAQRRRWFLRGADTGDPDACNTYVAAKL